MRLIFPGKMARDLREEKIGKGEFIAYLVLAVAALVWGIAYCAGLIDGGYWYQPAWLEWLDRALLALMLAGTTAVAYYVNKKGDGKRFWYRFLSLSVPIAVVVTIPAILIEIAGMIAGIISIEYYGYPDLVLMLVFYALGLWLTAKYMRIAAGA